MRTLALLLFCSTALAADPIPYVQHAPIAPTACDNDAINAAVNCEVSNGTDVRAVVGWSTLTAELTYVHGAGTGFTFSWQHCEENSGTYANDCTDTTDWHTISATATLSGATTLSNETVASGTCSVDCVRVYTVPLNYRRIRLGSIVATGSPTSSDKIQVKLTLARGR